MRLQATLEQRLARVRAEIVQLRAQLAVLDEQDAFQREVAADARQDALVDASPLSARGARAADGDARRIRRERDEVATRLRTLSAEQDRLLDELLERGGAPQGSR